MNIAWVRFINIGNIVNFIYQPKKNISFIFFFLISACGGSNESPPPNENPPPINTTPTLTIPKISIQPTVSLSSSEETTVTFTIEDSDHDSHQIDYSITGDIDVTIEGQNIRVRTNHVNQYTRASINLTATDPSENIGSVTLDINIFPFIKNNISKTLLGSYEPDNVKSKKLHMVILGDGYQEHELSKYYQDANEMVNALLTEPYIGAYSKGWNIHVIDTPSDNSGIAQTSAAPRSTFFNAYFGCAEIARLICANYDMVINTALSEYPDTDLFILVVNSKQSGGSGGQVAIYSAGNIDTALHELGHSFASLADEYVDTVIAERYLPFYFEGKYANISSVTNILDVPWAHHIKGSNYPTQEGEAGIGIFEGAYYHASGFYRPLSTSKMRELNAEFGPINAEQWAISMYEKLSPVIAHLPENNSLTVKKNTLIDFSVELLIDINVQSVRWYINETLDENYNDKTTISLQFETGIHRVEVQIEDDLSILKAKPNTASQTITWQVEAQE